MAIVLSFLNNSPRMPWSKALRQHAARLALEEKSSSEQNFPFKKDQMKAAESSMLLEDWMNMDLQIPS